MLKLWSEEAARVDENVQSPTARGKARTPNFVQRGLSALSHSKYFGPIAQRALIGDLKQVSSYMNDHNKRLQIQDRLVATVTAATRVVIGHSLGSVVAYEVLAAHPEWPVKALVTLGSPLGIRNLIFDNLTPQPQDGLGVWPGSIVNWTNIADQGDVVALDKRLAPLFGSRVLDQLVYNGATAHNALPYLTAKETGAAIQSGLAD